MMSVPAVKVCMHHVAIVILFCVLSGIYYSSKAVNSHHSIMEVLLPALILPNQKQQQQQQLRLCNRDEIRHGEWVPVVLDKPPYIPRKSKCYKPEDFERATRWDYYHWFPHAAASSAADSCEFRQWDSTLFCRLAKNRTIALAGDSLTWEHFASLLGLLGVKVGAHDELNFKGDDGQHYNQNKGMVMKVCNGTVRVAFVRNRYLLYVDSFINTTDPDVLILNRGAHYLGDQDLVHGFSSRKNSSGIKWIVTELNKWQQTCRDKGRRCLALWRTTVPGIPECDNFTKPATSMAEMEALVAARGPIYKYNHWDFRRQNTLILEQFENETRLNFDVIPAYEVGILRPDGHIGKGDCLHSCDPGSIDVYSTLLLHLLRLEASESIGE